jgi:hypothetical protein
VGGKINECVCISYWRLFLLIDQLFCGEGETAEPSLFFEPLEFEGMNDSAASRGECTRRDSTGVSLR